MKAPNKRLHSTCAVLLLLAGAACGVLGRKRTSTVWDCEELYQDLPNWWGYRLGQATRANDLQCVKYFLKIGDNPNQWNKIKETPIHYAAEIHAAAIMQVLVDYGANVDIVTDRAETALMIASCNGQTNDVTVLVDSGADIDYTNSRGENATNLACTCYGVGDDCQEDTIVAILDVDGPGIPCEELYEGDPQGFGHRMQYAIRAEDLYCTKYFLRARDNVNQWNRNGVTPLMDAAKTNSTEILQVTLMNGAYGNKQDVGGFSPLMYGSCYGIDNNVDVLVDAGVKTGLRDNHGNTAHDLTCTCTISTECLEDKIVEKIGNMKLKTVFNVDLKPDDNLIDNGTFTENNRDCNQRCQETEGCHYWTRIKKNTSTDMRGECLLRSKVSFGFLCFECDSGRVRFPKTVQ